MIPSRGAVDSVLTILFQARHFSVQVALRKGQKSGWKLLLTSQDLIPSEHMIVYLCLLGRRQNNMIQYATVWILTMLMGFQLLMTRIPSALARLGLHQIIKLQDEDLIIGVLFSLAITPDALFLFSDFPTVASGGVGCLSCYLEPVMCNVFLVFNLVYSLFLTFSLGKGAGLSPVQQSYFP